MLVVLPSVIVALPSVAVLLASALFGRLPIVTLAAAVKRPCASTVNVATVVALPYDPADTAVLARLIVPVVVIGPPVKPVPVAMLVTVPLVALAELAVLSIHHIPSPGVTYTAAVPEPVIPVK